MASEAASSTTSSVPPPSPRVFEKAYGIASEQDRPILLDYYVESVNGSAFIGQHTDTKDRLLIKSSDEYTSMITKIFKVDDCYIILTENSLYIVSTKIKARAISSNHTE